MMNYLTEAAQRFELALEQRPYEGRRTFVIRVLRKALATGLRSLGVTRADPITLITVHGADLWLPRSHALPHIVRHNPFYDTALPSFVRHLQTTSGSVVHVVDVGANVGDTAAIVAAAVGPDNVTFVCVEADPRNIPLLRKNTDMLSAEIIAAAAGTVTERRKGGFARHDGTSYITSGSDDIALVCLDDILHAKVDIVKIDTDGYELHVMRGLARTLRRDQPHIFIEVSPVHWEKVGAYSPIEPFALLRECGYSDCLIYDKEGYPISLCTLESPLIEHILNYGLAKPETYFDMLISPNGSQLGEFYSKELQRIGKSTVLF